MLLGVFSAGFGLRGFLIPNDLIDGGVMGISLLTNTQQDYLPLPALIIIFNIPFLFLGYRQISRSFSLKSILAITALAIVVAVVPYPKITDDKVLVAVFGGFFLGAGIGLTGLSFAGVAVLTAQLTEHSRGASSLAMAVVGVAFLLR